MYNFPVPVPAYTTPAVGTGTYRPIICVVLDKTHSIQHTHSVCVVKKNVLLLKYTITWATN